ncbi:2-oxoglutarate-Fe(II)-dependent oxygenase superfamily protein [Streptomyces brevispora]|uniref:2-oxoglutarate-Fe(II)-dependent oxygenase superfamily protein n=1 Tax=Streptomyces brevispora TaxID=887462 RepID=A0A561UWF7_9ACTN|nr:2OG-Fe(II) oxygenase [Streptomyces brevispora]TWG03697.1 2-oxoglutarate-Fe(II)-dependent oxygenase superfamily protein [Streptomyces brevispora]
MREIQRGKRFVIIDDFLSEPVFSGAQDLLERATFTRRESVISEEDGPAFRSKGVRFKEELGSVDAGGRPKVYEELARAVHAHSDFYGEASTDWNRIAFAFWKYPAGSRLGWHNDAGRGRQGEFILFLHDRWRPSWGGELKLIDEDPQPANADDDAESDLVRRMENRIDRSTTSPVAIVPKPNRLVLVKSDTVHTIGRVDPTAGDTLRRSLTGFVSLSPERTTSPGSAREKLTAILTG